MKFHVFKLHTFCKVQKSKGYNSFPSMSCLNKGQMCLIRFKTSDTISEIDSEVTMQKSINKPSAYIGG